MSRFDVSIQRPNGSVDVFHDAEYVVENQTLTIWDGAEIRLCREEVPRAVYAPGAWTVVGRRPRDPGSAA